MAYLDFWHDWPEILLSRFVAYDLPCQTPCHKWNAECVNSRQELATLKKSPNFVCVSLLFSFSIAKPLL